MKPEQFLKDFASLQDNRSYYDYRSNQPVVDRIDRKIEEITQSLIERDKKLVDSLKVAIHVLKCAGYSVCADEMKTLLKDIGEEI